MNSENPEFEQHVRDALSRAGLRPHEDEIAALIAQHSSLRASLERLYQVPVNPEDDLPIAFLL